MSLYDVSSFILSLRTHQQEEGPPFPIGALHRRARVSDGRLRRERA